MCLLRASPSCSQTGKSATVSFQSGTGINVSVLRCHLRVYCVHLQFHNSGRESEPDGQDSQDLQEADETSRRWLEQISSAGLLLHVQSLLSPNLVTTLKPNFDR